jgi:hypothetical protein
MLLSVIALPNLISLRARAKRKKKEEKKPEEKK